MSKQAEHYSKNGIHIVHDITFWNYIEVWKDEVKVYQGYASNVEFVLQALGLHYSGSAESLIHAVELPDMDLEKAALHELDSLLAKASKEITQLRQNIQEQIKELQHA